MKSDAVRTNIVLDSKSVEAGLKATGLKTRRHQVQKRAADYSASLALIRRTQVGFSE